MLLKCPMQLSHNYITRPTAPCTIIMEWSLYGKRYAIGKSSRLLFLLCLGCIYCQMLHSNAHNLSFRGLHPLAPTSCPEYSELSDGWLDPFISHGHEVTGNINLQCMLSPTGQPLQHLFIISSLLSKTPSCVYSTKVIPCEPKIHPLGEIHPIGVAALQVWLRA